MEKRIRYIKNNDGSLMSMRVLKTASGRELRSIVGADGKAGIVVEASTGLTVAEVKGTSSHKTKIALKKTLTELGVVFSSEGRKKRGTSV